MAFRLRNIALALAVAVGLCPSPAQSEPRAAFGPTQHDFGSVRRGERVVWIFRLRNGGDTPLAVTSVRFSMPGMTARLPGEVESGGDGSIALEWATDHVQGNVRGVTVVETNDPSARSITLVLAGTVHAPLDVEPIPAVFLSSFRDENVHRELMLRSNQPAPVTMRLGAHGGAPYTASLEPVEPGKTWRLTVKPARGQPPGRYEDTLRIECDDPAIGRIRLPVHVFIKPDVYANPDEIDFGEVPLIRIRQQPEALRFLEQFVLVKKREGTLRLRGIRSDIGALDLRATPSSTESRTVRIDAGLRLEALRPGTLEGTSWIDTDDPEFPRLTVRVRGRVVEK
jgi:hypothetical protein